MSTRHGDANLGDRRAGAAQGLTLAIAGFLPVLSILSLAPAVPSLMRHFADVPFATVLVPLMVTAPGLMVALLAPFAGLLVDRYGRRRLILIATFCYGFAGIAPFFVDHLPLMFATRLMVGAAEGLILIIVNALLADYFTVRERRTWITVQGVSGPILGTGSIALAGALTALYWNGAFLIYAAALLIFAVMVFVLYEPRPAGTPMVDDIPAPATPFPTRVVLSFCAATLFASVLYYVFIVQSGLAFEATGEASSARLGFLISICSLGTPIGALVFNLLSRRVGGDRLIVSFLAFMGVGMVGMGMSRSVEMMAAFGFIQKIGAGITVAGLIFWVSRLLPPEHRGRGFGMWTCAFFAGQFVSPVVVGLVRHFTGGILPTFVAMGCIALAGAVALLIGGKMLPRPIDSDG